MTFPSTTHTDQTVVDTMSEHSCHCSGRRGKLPARVVLYLLSWSGFLVSFMMRNDINFALVAMTRPLSNANDNASTAFSNDLSTYNNNSILHTTSNCYEWSTTIKSMIVSSFYWSYVMSQICGGVATQYFGTKQVFGWSQFVTAVCSLVIPFAADIHYSTLIFLRLIQGFASGQTWPAMYAIVGHWIPLSERSRFMSSFQGFSIGIGLTYPLCGFLIHNLGWRYVFFTTGSLGVAWCIIWYLLAFNTPQEHPRITREELIYIEMNVSADVKDSSHLKIPWRHIFVSKATWAIGITTFGRIWIHYIFIVSGPNFMQNILGFEYTTNGVFSGMPFICSYISSVVFCYIADEMIRRKFLTLTNVRKLFTALSQVIPALLIYCIGYVQNITLLLIFWFAAIMLITASYAGAMVNIVDIAPNFSGPVLAFCQTIHMSASFLSPLAAGILIKREDSIDQWRTMFKISAIIAIVTYIFYQIYGTGEVQKWNYSRQSSDETINERQNLRSATGDANNIPKN